MDLGSDEEDGANLHISSDHENSDEGGKYHIQRRQPGRGSVPLDFLAAYTTDDDEDHDEAGEHPGDSAKRKKLSIDEPQLSFQRIEPVSPS